MYIRLFVQTHFCRRGPGVFYVYQALFGVYRALLIVYRALLSVYNVCRRLVFIDMGSAPGAR